MSKSDRGVASYTTNQPPTESCPSLGVVEGLDPCENSSAPVDARKPMMNVLDLLSKVSATPVVSDGSQVLHPLINSSFLSTPASLGASGQKTKGNEATGEGAPAKNILDLKGSLHPDLQSILQSALNSSSPQPPTTEATPVLTSAIPPAHPQAQASRVPASHVSATSATNCGLLVQESTLRIIRDMKERPVVEEEDESTEKSEPRRRRIVKTVLTRLEDLDGGPLFLLKQAMIDRWRVKVWVRGPVQVRSVCTGFLLLFDKHMNLVLSDVDELYRNPLLLNRRDGRPSKKKKKKKRKKKASLCPSSIPKSMSSSAGHPPTTVPDGTSSGRFLDLSDSEVPVHLQDTLCATAMNVDGQFDVDSSDSSTEGPPGDQEELDYEEEGNQSGADTPFTLVDQLSDRASHLTNRTVREMATMSSKESFSESAVKSQEKKSKSSKEPHKCSQKPSHSSSVRSSSSHKPDSLKLSKERRRHSEDSKHSVKSVVSHVERTPDSDRHHHPRPEYDGSRSNRDHSPHRKHADDQGHSRHGHHDRHSSRYSSHDSSSHKHERSSERQSPRRFEHGQSFDDQYPSASSATYHRSRHRDRDAEFESKHRSHSSHREHDYDRDYDSKKHRDRDEYYQQYERYGNDISQERHSSRSVERSSHHRDHQEHSPSHKRRSRDSSPRHASDHDDRPPSRPMDLRDRLRERHADSWDDDRRGSRCGKSVSQDDDSQYDFSHSPERREAASSSIHSGHHSVDRHQRSHYRSRSKSESSQQEYEIESKQTSTPGRERHRSGSADEHGSGSDDPHRGSRSRSGHRMDHDSASVSEHAGSNDGPRTDRDDRKSHRKPADSRSSSRSLDLRQKLLKKSLKCSRQSPGRSLSSSETAVEETKASRPRHTTGRPQSSVSSTSGSQSRDDGEARQSRDTSQHRPISTPADSRTDEENVQKTPRLLRGGRNDDNKENVDLPDREEKSKSFKEILRRHVNQLFIRGDNVVMVAIADK